MKWSLVVITALVCWGCKALSDYDVQHATTETLLTSTAAGSFHVNGMLVNMSRVEVTGPTTGQHEVCVGSTLQGGIAELPFFLCEDNYAQR